MTDFKAKMHQIRFRLGLCPRPRWGSLQRSPDPLAGFGGRFAAGGVWAGKEEGKGMEGEVEGREREGPQVTVEPGPLRTLLRHWNIEKDKHTKGQHNISGGCSIQHNARARTAIT